MLFNSAEFILFFIIVYTVYLFCSHRWQNRLLLAASYIFYGSWDWRFLSLIFISTALDYICGIKIEGSSTAKKRKLFLGLSIAGNLTILGIFKYFDFFALSLQQLFGWWHIPLEFQLLHVILPVGISFYTFQTMSYTIDIYRGEIKPTKDLLTFALFVAYFPQLVAGPIERAKHLLPQLLSPRHLTWEKFKEGVFLFLWGFFLKVFAADNLSQMVDAVFGAGAPYNGLNVLIAVYAFAFQIFCDFAGYSNMARGISQCMGIEVMVNFNLPYFATNPSDFWKRWHISLSQWLKDYLYIPLGGNRKGTVRTFYNIMIVMLLGGLWHGAAWTFVLWGAYHGLLIVCYRLISPAAEPFTFPRDSFMDHLWFAVRVVFFFHLTSLGWLFFRAQDFGQILAMMSALAVHFQPNGSQWLPLMQFLFFAMPVLLIQCWQWASHDSRVILKQHWLVQPALYAVLAYLLMMYGANRPETFIYFQF
ncbi:MAG: membrane-bound O-acyltransferase family protein [Candidatus Omnitrophica bacterium CG11_big_fil_rev_8_21_14_0_20_45_26]|uniref:Membrane-bound O-acyltransferase family protein n=1 Tax=Candidatus Abzuiibacterium crystallinum TaxID=1974748 RepID=A0A2H0LQX8_9BACT|nr:MAG: membrane-bound O-acyltransferase family protein [Candidatus Omnitrophica bacterium CG11_big_fil_rev_8_21_14_0_20_45_26]PIW64756.1 MAG: membrane-bound O-acyltransferase family protein [Candidatus Omnitrophica bacterium CG12_big_fil_rev_8_21_14_0_65_45_16]